MLTWAWGSGRSVLPLGGHIPGWQVGSQAEGLARGVVGCSARSCSIQAGAELGGINGEAEGLNFLKGTESQYNGLSLWEGGALMCGSITDTSYDQREDRGPSWRTRTAQPLQAPPPLLCGSHRGSGLLNLQPRAMWFRCLEDSWGLDEAGHVPSPVLSPGVPLPCDLTAVGAMACSPRRTSGRIPLPMRARHLALLTVALESVRPSSFSLFRLFESKTDRSEHSCQRRDATPQGGVG